MLKHRVLTAAIGLPLLLVALITLPPLYVCIVFLASVAFSVYEIGKMLYPAFIRKFHPNSTSELKYTRVWTWFCLSAACLMFSVSTMLDLSGTERGGIIAVLNLVILVGTFTGPNIDQSIIRITCVLISLCYGCLPWLTIWDLYLMGEHASYVLLLLSIVMMGDTGAYFAGKHLGKHKLAPRFSPKKTWEGVFGGLLASIIGVLSINAIFDFSLGPWWLMVILAVVGGVAGVMGDLVESSFKRFAEVKDSGTIFPGHGGFLDRVDSVLFAAPICWLILYTYKTIAA